jgi:transcriptional regulator GlxA family with amidase domain
VWFEGLCGSAAGAMVGAGVELSGGSWVSDPAANHTLTAMARRTGISERHVTRLFHDEAHTTPARYVERVRLEAAQVMLERGDEPLATIARRTGFGSPESMRRAFAKHLDITPGAFRSRFRTTGADARPADAIPESPGRR